MTEPCVGCPLCGTTLQVDDLSRAGSTINCPKCGGPVALPDLEPREVPRPAVQPPAIEQKNAHGSLLPYLAVVVVIIAVFLFVWSKWNKPRPNPAPVPPPPGVVPDRTGPFLPPQPSSFPDSTYIDLSDGTPTVKQHISDKSKSGMPK